MGETTTRENQTAIAAAIVALAVLLLTGFWYFPGHTFLQSDTQIYLPILDRLADGSLYEKDPVALRPHVSFTIYDEATLGLRRLTGLSFEHALQAQQLAFRFAGLVGVFLLGLSGGLAVPWAVLLASLFGLGATIVGPAVLTVEYEPVPRGFAVPLLMLGVGLAAHARWLAAGFAIGLAVLYHPPTCAPVLAAGAWAMWRTRGAAGDGRFKAAWPILAAGALLFLFSRWQAGATEPQQLFSTISPSLEKLQRLRGSYNFVSIWLQRWAGHWLFIFALDALSWWRLRGKVPVFVSTLATALIVYGALAIPASFLLLEQAKWSLLPQFQPVRALLFVTLLAMLGAGLQGIFAAQSGRAWQSILWFSAAFGLSGQVDLELLPWLAVSDPVFRLRLVVFLSLGAVTFAAIRFWKPLLLASLLLPAYLMPQVAKVRNYPALDHPEIHQLADWARAHSPRDAVFQFIGVGPALHPGLFRVYSRRAVYVDWKVGGQVNLLEEFAREWWTRWQTAGEPKTFNEAQLASLGIDYIIVTPKAAIPNREPAYRNEKYVVYRCGSPRGAILQLETSSTVETSTQKPPSPPRAPQPTRP